MNKILAILFCLVSSTASAQQFEFRGEFVKTYSVSKDAFLKTLPPNTKLQCNKFTCASRNIRLYVFKNKEKAQTFWTLEYYNVQYDEPKSITAFGKAGHVVVFDETNQVIYRSHETIEADMKRSKEIPNAPLYTNEEIKELMDHNEAVRAAELAAQEKELSKTYPH